jgi:hypothetical protein
VLPNGGEVCSFLFASAGPELAEKVFGFALQLSGVELVEHSFKVSLDLLIQAG